jgi:hypothetical protein
MHEISKIKFYYFSKIKTRQIESEKKLGQNWGATTSIFLILFKKIGFHLLVLRGRGTY